MVCAIDGHPLEVLHEAEGPSRANTVLRGRCPACGVANDYAPTVELRGSFSWIVFLAGGIFAVLFRNAGRRRKVQCKQCETLFYIRKPLSFLSLVLFWLLLSPVIVALLMLLGSILNSLFFRAG